MTDKQCNNPIRLPSMQMAKQRRPYSTTKNKPARSDSVAILNRCDSWWWQVTQMYRLWQINDSRVNHLEQTAIGACMCAITQANCLYDFVFLCHINAFSINKCTQLDISRPYDSQITSQLGICSANDVHTCKLHMHIPADTGPQCLSKCHL